MTSSAVVVAFEMRIFWYDEDVSCILYSTYKRMQMDSGGSINVACCAYGSRCLTHTPSIILLHLGCTSLQTFDTGEHCCEELGYGCVYQSGT
jgi:hypothetical protein